MNLSRVMAAAVFFVVLAGCQTQKPVVEATGVAVGAGVDVPGGSNEDFIVNVGRRIYFSEGSAELSPTAKVTLDKQADWLARYTRYKIKIEGFADDKGSPEFNKQLGMKRAEATRAYFASKGLAANRMRVKTFGNEKERLVNSCDDLSCKSQNRRVVTVLETERGA